MILKIILSLLCFALKHKFELAYYKYVIRVYKKKTSPIRFILIVRNFACTVTGHKYSPTCDVAV